jgi:hypothetical protein
MNIKAHIAMWIAGIAIVAASIVSLAACFAPQKHEDLWFEAGKAGIQLAVVTVVGALLAAGLRYLETIRDERRKLKDHRREILRQIIAAYNQVKAVRRVLRAYGFRSPSSGTLSQTQIDEFHAQMKLLNAAQLTFESLARDLAVGEQIFQDTKGIIEALRGVEKYLGHIIQDWEKSSASVQVGVNVSAITSLERLQTFLSRSEVGFEGGAAKHMDYVEARIQAEIAGGAETTAQETPTAR